MTDTLRTPLVIAHHFGPHLEAALPPLPPGVSWLRLGPETAWEMPPEVQVLLALPPSALKIVLAEKPPGWPGNLRWVQTVTAGVDQFPAWAFDVPLFTCGRGSNSTPIAEFVLAALLAVAKKLPDVWISDAAAWKQQTLGTLYGKTLGLIGYGSIGQAIAARAKPFGMKIIAVRRSASSGQSEDGVQFASLDEVLAQADHLAIAAPLTAATKGLIGQDALAKVKPGVHLVNISRGRIVDQEALLAALDDGRVGFASLDVTEPEPLTAGHRLYSHPHVHLSAHVSWSSGEAGLDTALAYFVENLRRFLAGEELEGIVQPALGY